MKRFIIVIIALMLLVSLSVIVSCVSQTDGTDTGTTGGEESGVTTAGSGETSAANTSDGANPEMSTEAPAGTTPAESTSEETISAESSAQTTSAEASAETAAETSGEETTSEPEQTLWDIKSGRTHMSLSYTDGKLYVSSFGRGDNEYIASPVSPVLPSTVECGGILTATVWKFKGSESIDGGYRFKFTDASDKFDYSLFISANGLYDAPLEIHSELTNRSGAECTYYAGKFFTLPLSM